MAIDPYFGDTDAAWESHAVESNQLAGLIRRARLTLLVGPPRSGKSALLHLGLMPRLQRRRHDAAGAPPPEGAGDRAPAGPERRRSRTGGQRECAVLFDAWGAQAAARLKARLQDELQVPPEARPQPAPPLSHLLLALHDRTGVQVLLVLDAFDYCLDPPAALAHSATAFIAELLDTIADARVPAHVLIAVQDRTEPLLAPWRVRLPDLGDNMLRLPPRPDWRLPEDDHEPAWAGPEMPGIPLAEQLRALPPRETGVAPEVVDAIALALESFEPREAGSTPVGARAGAGRGKEPPAPAPPPKPPSPRSPRSAPAAPWRGPRAGVLGLVLSSVTALAWWTGARPPAEPAPIEREVPRASLVDRDLPAPAAKTEPLAPARPTFTITADDGHARTAAQTAADLARWIAPAAGVTVQWRPATGWAEALGGLRAPGQLAIARYDALQAERARPAAVAPPLQLVMPLYGEALHLIVRADSTLQFIHQIEGRRINVGPAASSRALTAGALYAGLFGVRLPVALADAGDEAAALQGLLAGTGPEVLVHVAAQPSPWIASLPAAAADRLRLLRLDPSHPASRRALRQFLPDELRQAESPAALPRAATPTLSMMAFLVTGAGPGGTGSPALEPLAQALCDRLDVLRREGHPAWRAVRPTLRLEAGWPYEPHAASGLRRCADGNEPPDPSLFDRVPTVANPPSPRSPS